jgi:hypothetical protein
MAQTKQKHSIYNLVPILTCPTPSELGARPEIVNLGNIDSSLYPHQERARRGTALAKAALFIHEPGLGKTLSMILSVESKRNTCGPLQTVIVITKESIFGFVKDDIQSHLEQYGITKTEALKFYRFFTYVTFNTTYGKYSPDDLADALRNSTIVIDEFHSVYSYLKRPSADSRSIFETLIVLRNILPDNLILAMTATPMMHSSHEIRYAAHVLLTQSQLSSCVPSAPDFYEASLQATSDYVYTPKVTSDIPEELATENVDIDIQYANAIVKFVPIFYKAAEIKSKPTFIGKDVALKSSLLIKTGIEAEDSQDEQVLVRKLLPMGDVQESEYDVNFTGTNFFRKSREISVCSSSFDVTKIAELDRYSALFAYWLRVEKTALEKKHWGVSAWYFDDIVENGARIFRDVLVASGWDEWKATDKDPNKPVVLLLSGDESITALMRKDLFDPNNVRGTLVRTIIYTRAVRDGVSFPGVFRGGSVIGWTLSGQQQADARRLRMNSFDLFEPYFDPRSRHHEEFMSVNAQYIKDDSISPLIFDAIVHTRTVELNPATGTLSPKSSIDTHMLYIRGLKGDEIRPVFEKLVENSIDNIAKTGDSDRSNYFTHYFFSDMDNGFSAYKKFPSTIPWPIAKIASDIVPISIKRYFGTRAFVMPKGGEVEGPLDGCPMYAWGRCSMGLGLCPGQRSVMNRIGVISDEKIDINKFYHITDEETLVTLSEIIDNALSNIAKHILERGVVDFFRRAWTLDPSKVVSSGQAVLLAMYARFWVFSAFQIRVIDGSKKIVIGIADPSAPTYLVFGTNLPKSMVELSQHGRLIHWEGIDTKGYGIVDGVLKTINMHGVWNVPNKDHRTWMDKFTLHHFVSNLENLTEYGIITPANTFVFNKVEQGKLPRFMYDPKDIATMNKGVGTGNANKSRFTPYIKIGTNSLLNYDPEIGIKESYPYFKEKSILFDERKVFRSILFPIAFVNGLEKRPLFSVSGTSVTNNISGDSEVYARWAYKILSDKFQVYWTVNLTIVK